MSNEKKQDYANRVRVIRGLVLSSVDELLDQLDKTSRDLYDVKALMHNTSVSAADAREASRVAGNIVNFIGNDVDFERLDYLLAKLRVVISAWRWGED